MSLRGSNATAVRVEPGPWRPRSSTRVSFCPATTCALVTTSPSPRHPARALDARARTPLPRIFTTLVRGRRARRGSRAIPRRGGATRASGPSMRGNGSKPRQRVRAAARTAAATVLRLLQDRRALDLAPRRRRWRERDRAEDPHDRRARRTRSARRRAAPSTASHAGRASPGRASARRAPRSRPRRPCPRSARRPGRTRAPRRAAPVGEHERAEPRADATRRPRSPTARARPRRTPAPSRTGPAAARARRSASRCRSRQPSVPAAHVQPRARRLSILDW